MRVKTSIVFTVWLILVLAYAASKSLLSIQSLNSGWASVSANSNVFSASLKKQKTYPFTVQVVPKNAIVKIMNIKPVYRKGMLLAPGKYHLNVSAPAHLPRQLWVNHKSAPGVFSVTLADAGK